jgi:hypothetical protein
MFSKKEGFKYEVEVKALIREATEPLNQRIFALEMVNQRLELEVNTLRHGIYNDIQRLEKRITDFTDVWHPIMTENINRIKIDLEKTIVETERKDIANIQFDLEEKMKQIIEDNEANKLIRVSFGIPQIKGLKLKLSEIANCYNNEHSWSNNCKTFNICDIYNCGLIIVDDDNKIIVSGIDKDGNKINCNDYSNFWKIILEEEGLYTMWNYLTDKCYNIKLHATSFHSQTYGVPSGNIIFPTYPNCNKWGDGYCYGRPFEQVMKNRKQFINWVKYGGEIPKLE